MLEEDSKPFNYKILIFQQVGSHLEMMAVRGPAGEPARRAADFISEAEDEEAGGGAEDRDRDRDRSGGSRGGHGPAWEEEEQESARLLPVSSSNLRALSSRSGRRYGSVS